MQDLTPTIALGDPSQTRLQGPQAHVQQHPAGMNFYKRSWPVERLGRIRYLQGQHSFDLPRVSHVMGSFDRDTPEDGIYAWDINAFPMDGPTIPHQQARDELFRLFAQLRRAGWRRFLYFSEPRLRGADTFRYALAEIGSYPLDPEYIPDMQQWMQINRHLPYWSFWADGTYMMIRVMDEPSLRSLQRDGVYMFSIDISSESAFWEKGFRSVDDMRRWPELLPRQIEQNLAQRARTEAQLQAQGYIIDTTYQDPPILALRKRP